MKGKHCIIKIGSCEENRNECVVCPYRDWAFRLPAPTPTPFSERLSDAMNVTSPHHYSRWKMQPIEFIAINDLPAWMANVIKYIMRYDAKDGLKDMYKARAYLDMKIRELEGVERFWEEPVNTERALNACT